MTSRFIPNKMKNSRKAVSELLSWVFIILLVVTLAIIAATFIENISESTTENIKTQIDREDCNFVSIAPTMCQKPLTLYMNITNNNLLTIKEIRFRILYLDNSTQNTKQVLTILPAETIQLELLTNTLIQKLDIIPVIQKENKLIICEMSTFSTESINIC